MASSVAWTPSFKEFANYRLVHETTFDLPIQTGEFWKLRMGVNNDYQSEPVGGVERLDTVLARPGAVVHVVGPLFGEADQCGAQGQRARQTAQRRNAELDHGQPNGQRE